MQTPGKFTAGEFVLKQLKVTSLSDLLVEIESLLLSLSIAMALKVFSTIHI